MLRADENLEAVLIDQGDSVELYYVPEAGTEKILRAKLGSVKPAAETMEASEEAADEQ